MKTTRPLPFSDDDPLPDGGPLQAFLFTLRKAHRELAGPTLAADRFARLVTRRHAREYIAEVMPQLLELRRQRRKARAKP